MGIVDFCVADNFPLATVGFAGSDPYHENKMAGKEKWLTMSRISFITLASTLTWAGANTVLWAPAEIFMGRLKIPEGCEMEVAFASHSSGSYSD